MFSKSNFLNYCNNFSDSRVELPIIKFIFSAILKLYLFCQDTNIRNDKISCPGVPYKPIVTLERACFTKILHMAGFKFLILRKILNYIFQNF